MQRGQRCPPAYPLPLPVCAHHTQTPHTRTNLLNEWPQPQHVQHLQVALGLSPLQVAHVLPEGVDGRQVQQPARIDLPRVPRCCERGGCCGVVVQEGTTSVSGCVRRHTLVPSVLCRPAPPLVHTQHTHTESAHTPLATLCRTITHCVTTPPVTPSHIPAVDALQSRLADLVPEGGLTATALKEVSHDVSSLQGKHRQTHRGG